MYPLLMAQKIMFDKTDILLVQSKKLKYIHF